MKREFVIQRQGKDHVLYAGLLDLAHEKGLVSIQTEAIRIEPNLALFKAVVTITNDKDGARTFEGHGDATAENVGRNIAPHFIRMAETRAKARALRDALNIGAAALEELGDDDEPEPRRQTPPPRPQPRDLETVEGQGEPPWQRETAPTPIARAREFAPPAPTPPANGDTATPAQINAIYGIGKGQHGMSREAVAQRSMGLFRCPPEQLTKKQASDFITSLKGA